MMDNKNFGVFVFWVVNWSPVETHGRASLQIVRICGDW